MDNFEKLFKARLQEKGFKQEDIAFDIRMDPAKLSKIIRGKKPRADEYLRQIASHPDLGLDFMTLRAWKLADEASTDEAIELIRILFPDKDELKKVLKQVGVEL